MACDCRTFFLLATALSLATVGCTGRVIDQDLVERGGSDDDGRPAGECARDEDCDGSEECFEGTCVSGGVFRVTLSWEFESDLDLHVVTPRGNEIFYNTDGEVDGGRFDVDDCSQGMCEGPLPYVENIAFDGDAYEGEYSVWVDNFDGASGGPFLVVVSGDVNREWEDSIPAAPVESEWFQFEWDP